MNNKREFFLYEDNGNNLIDADDIKKIYDRIGDDISRKIFINRLYFSMFEDNCFLEYLFRSTDIGEALYNELITLKGNIYIYGAGRKGIRIKEAFPSVRWKKYVDKCSDRIVSDLPVISIDEFANEYISNNTKLLISCACDIEVIVKDLFAIGVKKKDLIILEELSSKAAKNIYFDGRCLENRTVSDGFVDVGSYNGSSSLDYISFCQNDSSHLYAFEPNYDNYQLCKKNLSKYENALVYNYGVSNRTEEALVSSEGGMSQIICLDCEEVNLDRIKLVSLDDFLSNENVEYIKVDVEGYEENVINGAKSIIKNQTPILAISVYHKRSDIWKLPKLLLDIDSSYRFYFGHYTLSIGDTVMYCIPQNK